MAEPQICEIPVELVLVGKGGESEEPAFHADLTIKYLRKNGDNHTLEDLRILRLKIPATDVLRFWSHMGETINRKGEVCGECCHGKFYHFDGEGVCEMVGCSCVGFIESETKELIINMDVPADPPKDCQPPKVEYCELDYQSFGAGLLPPKMVS